MRYIAQNVKYPKSAQENGTQGKVVVQFVVDTDGSIINKPTNPKFKRTPKDVYKRQQQRL